MAAAAALAACGSSGGADDDPNGGDADGVKGGNYTFAVTVDDTAFAPAVLKAQNDGNITLTLTNTGAKPHDLSVDGIPTAHVGPVAPAQSATVSFVAPDKEGIYVFRSTQSGDMHTGQLILQ